MKKLLITLICLISLCCRDKGGETVISEEGFVVYQDLNIWQFVPAKSIDLESCMSSFKTENLNKGMQFTPHSEKHVQAVKSVSLDFNVENIDSGFAKKYYTINIAPVKVKYKVIYNRTKKITDSQPEFLVKVNGNIVQFPYDFLNVEIEDLQPLRCLELY
jgi:hypothetical protein